MSSKAKKSSSSKHRKKSSTTKASEHDVIIDERFAAAITRPQFHKAKRSSGSSSSGGGSNYQRNTQDDDNLDGTLTLGSGNSGGGGGGGGLGESLTEAIRSDDRFSAALLDSDKFGCVPDRDKYGRKTTKKTKKKKKKERNERGGEDNNENEEDNDRKESLNEHISKGKKSKSNTEKQDSQSVDNSMEARIAYLNALSRGDISGSSSSDDSSAGSDDDENESEDHDSDDDISIQGTLGIFDPSHKSHLPGDDANSNSEGDNDDDEETDEPSPYLCILNLNWEHIRAVDVYAMLHSFCPPGTLKKVEVYPSDFGRERMEKERVEGPPAEIWKKCEKDNEEKKQRGVHLDESDEEEEEEDASGKDSDGIPSDDEVSDDTNRDDRPTNSSDDDDIEDDDDDVDEDEEEDDDEDVLDLNDATSKLYSHFPPQSAVVKNSKRRHDQEEEDGFDIEKLREYEASKLRYYFAIASFSTCDAASQVYDTVDGMEMEDSAAEIDVRVLPSNQYQCTIQDRAVRDACDRLPAKYTPPENATATALRQSRVTCSWERGDADRERKLNYGMGKDAWEALATGEDLKLYLATSDNSSCSSDGDSEEEHDVDDELESRVKENAKKNRGSSTRKMLGLATSDSEEENDDAQKSLDSVCSSDESSSDCSDNKVHGSYPNETESESKSNPAAADIDELIRSKEVAFVPGKQILDEKIRAKIAQSTNIKYEVGVDVVNRREELSPFQKYLQKRKEKKRERRQASRRARKNDGGQNLDDGNEVNNDDMYGIDPEFGLAQFSDEEPGASGDAVGDNRHDDDGSPGRSTPELKGRRSDKVASSREELELLLAGDDGVFTVQTSLFPVRLIL